jgi:hypothetical protein
MIPLRLCQSLMGDRPGTKLAWSCFLLNNLATVSTAPEMAFAGSLQPTATAREDDDEIWRLREQSLSRATPDSTERQGVQLSPVRRGFHVSCISGRSLGHLWAPMRISSFALCEGSVQRFPSTHVLRKEHSGSTPCNSDCPADFQIPVAKKGSLVSINTRAAARSAHPLRLSGPTH